MHLETCQHTHTHAVVCLLKGAWMTQECSDSRLEDLTGKEGDQWKKTYLFLHSRLMNTHTHTHTHTHIHTDPVSHHGSLRLRFTKLTAAGLWASTGKKEERGMLENGKRERKRGWRENRKQWGGEERSKRRKTQTAGEREKSLWHIVVWRVVVSLQYSSTSRLPSSDVMMELELDGSKLHKYTNPLLYKQAWYWCRSSPISCSSNRKIWRS